MFVMHTLFYFFGLIALFSSYRVITSRNTVVSALYLILVFVATAGLFILLGAEFLAMLLVIVYVGAIVVLFLFVTMMLDTDLSLLQEGFRRHAWLLSCIGFVLLIELVVMNTLWGDGAGSTNDPAQLAQAVANIEDNTQAIGSVLYTDYVYDFQLSGLILLVAMMGAIVLTLKRKRNEQVKRQDPSKQLTRTPGEAVSLKEVGVRQGVDTV